MKKSLLPVLASAVLLSAIVPAAAANEPSGEVYARSRFAPMEIPRLAPRPAWWQVRPLEIIAACRKASARKEIIARTPLGYPVYALFYGECPEAERRANWSAASASDDISAYLGAKPRKQTVLWVSGFHGAEAEGVAGSMNFISLLETGKDLRGKADPPLVELIRQYNCLIIPCVNMDGRSISPDHLNGATYEEFRKASQGTWRDGSLIGWRGSKAHFPLPLDRVEYPGGYPNSEGFNPMHDASPGNLCTAEARGVLRLIERYGVDFVLNAHSFELEPLALPPAMIADEPRDAARRVYLAVNEGLMALRTKPFKRNFDASPANLRHNFNTLVPLVSGGGALTLESPVSQGYTFDQLLEVHFITLRAMLVEGLKKPFITEGRP